MTIVVTGTSGHLGRLAVEALLERGVPASDIVATARDTTRIADLAALGVSTARADYDDPASLRPAFEGADRLLLVSGSEIGRRVAQHRNVIDAAAAAGVDLRLSAAARQWLVDAAEAGLGDEDYSAVLAYILGRR